MYHRFCATENVGGYRVHESLFRRQIERLSSDFAVWSLGEYFQKRLSGHPVPRNLAVITVDDGYRDFYEVAYPVLSEFGVPATFFPATDFVDSQKWLWHDVLTYALETTSAEQISFKHGAVELNLDLRTKTSREIAWARICNRCILETDEQKWELLQSLLIAAEVILPDKPLDDYAPVTWAELAEMSEGGIEVGAHTRSHPVLSRVPENALEAEIVGSKQLIERRLGKAVKTFCYPNGQPADVTDTVIDTVSRAGFLGAVVTHRNPPTFDRFTTSRLGIDTDALDFLWKIDGWEYLTAAKPRF